MEGKRYSRGENIDPRFTSYDSDETPIDVGEGYIVKRGYSPAKKVNIIEVDSDTEYSDQEFTMNRKVPQQYRRLRDGTKVRKIRSGSPIKKEVAKQFVNVLGNLGNHDYSASDIKTQEEMMDKLHLVESSLKKMKTNIRKYNDNPWKGNKANRANESSTVPQVSFRKEGHNFDLLKDQLNSELLSTHKELKQTLKDTEEHEKKLIDEFENVMRSPVKEVDNDKIQILIEENRQLMEKAEEYVSLFITFSDK